MENPWEIRLDLALGLCFVLLGGAILPRMVAARGEPVISTFYLLAFLTAMLRAVWFLIPSYVLEPCYAPAPLYAFKGEWVGTFVSQLLLSSGSLTLFSIFILVVIYWADLLRRVFKDTLQRSHPMARFLKLVGVLGAIETANITCFLLGRYSSQGMLLFDSCLLSLVSAACSLEMSMFSHRFRTVLKTLGDINNVSTDAQSKRIVWITVSANVFFLIRATCEIGVGVTLFVFWKRHGVFAMVFQPKVWDWYILIKHTSEVMILLVLLLILQGKPESAGGRTNAPLSSRSGYKPIPNAASPEAKASAPDAVPEA